MGGKSSPAPAPAPSYSPQQQAEAQMMLQRQQQEYETQQANMARGLAQIEQTKKEAKERFDKQEADKALAAKQAKSQGLLNTVYGNASSYDDQQIANLGFKDTYGIGTAYQQQLDRWKSEQDGDNFSGSYDYAGAYEKTKADVEKRERQKVQNGYTNLTTPGWEEKYFADTADDSILEAILGEQYTGANDQLSTAQKRGQVTEGAYSAATSTLGNKKKIANSTLQDLGLGVLGGYRGQLSDLGTKYGDRIANWSLGDAFGVKQAKSGFDSKAASLGGRLEGDVRRAVGDTQLFDIAGILGSAGVTAGASNSPLAGAFVNGAAKDTTTASDDEKKRLAGTTGVF